MLPSLASDKPLTMFEPPKRGLTLTHLWLWLSVSVVPMFLSVMQCADYNDMATEGRVWWEIIFIAFATQAGPFVGIVADPEMNRELVYRYAWISGGMILVGLTSFFVIKPSPYLFWKILAWVFYALAVIVWFGLGQVALKVALR